MNLRVPRARLWAFLALPCTACASYETVLEEFDSASTMASGESRFPDNSARLFESVGAAADEDNANEFARERMQTLVGKALGDRQRSTEVIWRLLWVAERDRSPLNRILALEGMSQLTEGLGLSMVVEDLTETGARTEDQSDFMLATLSLLAEESRQGALDASRRQELMELLGLCREMPLRTPGQRRQLVEELAPDEFDNLDPELRRAHGETLDRALEHAVYTMFILHLLDNLPSGIEVRRAAIREFHRRAGPDSVALLLRITRRPREVVPPGELGFDPSPYVLLELVRLCGQLDRERALQGSGTGPAPAEFLYEVIRAPSSPRGPRRGLHFMALEALALSLGMPVSFDQQWADEWFQEWVQERIRGGPDR